MKPLLFAAFLAALIQTPFVQASQCIIGCGYDNTRPLTEEAALNVGQRTLARKTQVIQIDTVAVDCSDPDRNEHLMYDKTWEKWECTKNILRKVRPGKQN